MNYDTPISPLLVRGGMQLPKKGLKRLLIRGTNWIGDAVMTLPALASIRKTWPDACIFMLAKPWVADIYRLCPHVDEIVVFESPGRHDGIIGKIRLAKDLQKLRFDGAILLQNAIEAAIIARLARIPFRAGFNSDGRGALLTHAVKRTAEVRNIHQTRYYLEMVKALGAEDVPVHVRIDPKLEDLSRIKPLITQYGLEDRPLIGMAPGATYGAAKKWFPERFAAVADRLADDFSAAILLFGSEADRESTARIESHTRHSVIDLAGKTDLRQAMALMARCRVFISNDSGLMHVAAALGVPTIAIFGSTNPITTGPAGNRNIIIRKDVPCSPCLKTDCPKDFQCMNLISVDDVYEAARRLAG